MPKQKKNWNKELISLKTDDYKPNFLTDLNYSVLCLVVRRESVIKSLHTNVKNV